MNLTINEASVFVHKLAERIKDTQGVTVVLAPTALALQSVSMQTDHHKFELAAQNFYWRDHGAFTGEISATQLRGLVHYALVGHSERRYIFGETNKDIRAKVQAAFRNGITPVLCIGETAIERANGETADVIHDQMIAGLSNITSSEAEKLVIAYEPVWAIGNGKNAVPGDVEVVVKAIRGQVRHMFGPEVSRKVRVLYGGSVTADNVKGYVDITGIDGLLVGAASLQLHAFSSVIQKVGEPAKATTK